jgi:glycosyltransferase involved in cell wall biosynthesis
MIKLAIIATHPIQYQVPWFRKLAVQDGIDLTVYYGLLPDAQQQGVGFGIPFEWDIPLLEGYKWQVLKNTTMSPSLQGFFANRVSYLDKVLSAGKYDVVILTGWQSFMLLQALWACRRLRIPCLIRAESNAMKVRPWWVRLLHRSLLAQYDAFLAIGKANRDFYSQYGVHPDRIFSCPYFVDNERICAEFEKVREERDKIRTGWNIPEDHVCFLYAGKLVAKKRILDLLKALDLACQVRAYDRAPGLHLLVAGTGELMAEAQSFVAAHALPVTFTGFLNQTQITRAYVAADCLILPSDYGETWGLVVNEAMVCGLPAIVSDRVGCGPDLVISDVTGAFFPFGDVSSLANKLIDFASDQKRLSRMGQQARSYVQSYSVDQAVKGTLQAIDAVVKVS